VLRDLDLAVEAGEMVGIVGASGVGKSTLLHLLGALDRTDQGTIAIDGTDLTTLADGDVVAVPQPARRIRLPVSTISSRNSRRSKTPRCRCGLRACRWPRRGRARRNCCRGWD
jgi:ABC-type glutathione transport system ATPase component